MSTEREKERGTAAWLAFALGGFGVHRFYLEEHGRGLLYLAFFWTFVPLLLGVRDGMRYLTTEEARWDAVYNAPTLVLRPHAERPAVPVGAPQVNVTVNTGEGDPVSRLEKLHALKEKGVISDEEFAAQKARLLERS